MYRRGEGTRLVGDRIGELHDLERRLGIVDEPTSPHARRDGEADHRVEEQVGIDLDDEDFVRVSRLTEGDIHMFEDAEKRGEV